jgi:2-amino-4-hydroxy-6-hydroxymethyldihydropteridine diphosphokinase
LVRAFLLLGSNEGDRQDFLERACVEIDRLAGTIVKKSTLYETEAWGITDQPAFLNRVVVIDTALTALELLKKVQSIETQLGRVRREKWTARTIDIDILFYDDVVIEIPELIIPHTEIAYRRFTLLPMVNVAPNLVHPRLKKTMTQLLDECSDPLSVVEYSGKVQ